MEKLPPDDGHIPKDLDQEEVYPLARPGLSSGDKVTSTSIQPLSENTSIVQRHSGLHRAVSTSKSSIASEVIESTTPLNTVRFASKELLCPWFPEADPHHSRAQTLQAKLSRRSTVLASACLTAWLVFLLNLLFTILIPTRFPNARLYIGDCEVSNRLDSGLHVVINILSSLLLGASNLCMQLLSAPTRSEIDKAHQQLKWLDIGIPSVRNLRHIAKGRMVVWLVLALSSLPLHFFYNSAVIETVPENEYYWAVVSPGFLQGDSFDIDNTQATINARANTTVVAMNVEYPAFIGPHPIGKPYGNILAETATGVNRSAYQNHLTASQARFVNGQSDFIRLNTYDCVHRYANYDRDVSDVFMVSSNDTLKKLGAPTSTNNSLFVLNWFGSSWDISLRSQSFWPCGLSNNFSCLMSWTWQDQPDLVADWNVWGYKIDYCLSKLQVLEDKCSIRFDTDIMIGVCVANLIKCLCICYTFLLYRKGADAPLSSLGDAAVSFLRKPDPTTKSMSLASRANVDKIWTSKIPQTWRLVRHRWHSVAPLRLWIGTILAGGALLLFSIGCVASEVKSVGSNTGTRLPDLGKYGFGQPSPYQISGWLKGGLYQGVMLANVFQVLVSIVYIQYNALITVFLVGDEWSRFACVRAKDPDRTSFMEVNEGDEEALLSEGSKARSSWLPRIVLPWQRNSHAYKAPQQSNYANAATHVRKTLRVSAPEGIQRSSYFVSMPMRYGIPLLSGMSVLHWLISQSLFVITSDVYRADGSIDTDYGLIVKIGYSVQATICTATLGFVFIVALVLLGRKRYQPTMPLACTCSAAISAACHPPEGDKDVWLFLVQWGVVSTENGVGHCALTTARDVTPPQVGREYA